MDLLFTDLNEILDSVNEFSDPSERAQKAVESMRRGKGKGPAMSSIHFPHHRAMRANKGLMPFGEKARNRRTSKKQYKSDLRYVKEQGFQSLNRTTYFQEKKKSQAGKGAIAGGLGLIGAGYASNRHMARRGKISHKGLTLAELIIAGGVGGGAGAAVGSRFKKKNNLSDLQPGMIEFNDKPVGLRPNKRYIRPGEVDTKILPAGTAGYLNPSPKNRKSVADNNAKYRRESPIQRAISGKEYYPMTKGGLIMQPSKRMGDKRAKAAGYPSEKEFRKSFKRHEQIHSIQSSKRGYRDHKKIRELMKDEFGAYRKMDRGIKDNGPGKTGRRIKRAISKPGGFAVSTGYAVVSRPELRKRAKMRLKQGGIGLAGVGLVGAGALALKNKSKKRSEGKEAVGFNVHANNIIEFVDGSIETIEFQDQRRDARGHYRSSASIFWKDGDAIKTREGFNHVVKKGKQVNKWGKRGSNAVRDVKDVVKGKPRRKDKAGRPMKREWEKQYAKNAAGAAVAAGGILATQQVVSGNADGLIEKATGGKVTDAGQKIRIGVKKAGRKAEEYAQEKLKMEKRPKLGKHIARKLFDSGLEPGMIEFSNLRYSVAKKAVRRATQRNTKKRIPVDRAESMDMHGAYYPEGGPKGTKKPEISIPRLDKSTRDALEGLGKGSENRPVYALLHEGGHATSKKKVTRSVREDPSRLSKGSLDEERRANRKAIENLKRSGANKKEIAHYRKFAIDKFKTYKNSAAMNEIHIRRAKDENISYDKLTAKPTRAELRKVLRDEKNGIRGTGFDSIFEPLNDFDVTAGTIYNKDGSPALRYSDARGKSARIHSGDSRRRNRRKKRWHEKVENERKLWAGGALATTAAAALISPRMARRMAKNKKNNIRVKDTPKQQPKPVEVRNNPSRIRPATKKPSARPESKPAVGQPIERVHPDEMPLRHAAEHGDSISGRKDRPKPGRGTSDPNTPRPKKKNPENKG